MAQPYLGEIRMFAGNFNPREWEFCNGQLLPISEHVALFDLIGTTYGGDGESTFALPNLQSRVPLHMGNGSFGTTYILGEQAGVESVTLTTQQIPVHTHPFVAATVDGTQTSPANNMLATPAAGINLYFEDAPTTNFSAGAVTPQGGSQPHENRQPFLCINYIISLVGIFPSQT